jgi:protein-S-isoprenylcysteine O-methyltransferase Ste14
VLHLFSLETRRDAALLSAVWAGTALLAWIRLRQRERVLRAELESYEHHAQELGRDET